MPNYELTSPLYLAVLCLYFITSSIKMFDIRMTQAKKGMMGNEMAQIIRIEPPLPQWIGFVFILDWILAGLLFILNWKITIFVWIIRFILKVIPVLETVGNFLLFPFRPKTPDGVSDAHLFVANTIIQLQKTSTENKELWDLNYARMKEAAKGIYGTPADESAIVASLEYLGYENFDEYSNYARADVADLCEQRRREIHSENQQARWKEEERIQEEKDREADRELKEYLRKLELEDEQLHND